MGKAFGMSLDLVGLCIAFACYVSLRDSPMCGGPLTGMRGLLRAVIVSLSVEICQAFVLAMTSCPLTEDEF